MKNEHKVSIPSSLICKRWRRDAKSDYICSIPVEKIDAEKMDLLRFDALVLLCNTLCDVASKNVDDFREIRDEILSSLLR